jgi:hypothetical protein
MLGLIHITVISSLIHIFQSKDYILQYLKSQIIYLIGGFCAPSVQKAGHTDQGINFSKIY